MKKYFRVLTKIPIIFTYIITYSILITSIGTFNCMGVTVEASVSEDYDNWAHLPIPVLKEMSENYIEESKPDSALVCYSIIINRLNNKKSFEDRHELAVATMDMGYMYSVYFYDFKKAHDYFTSALKISEKNKDKKMMARCYLNLGALYSSYHFLEDDGGLKDESLKMYNQAYRIAKDNNEWSTVLTAINNLSRSAFYAGELNKINSELEDFLQEDIPSQIPMSKFTKSFIKGLLALEKNNYDIALNFFNESLRQIDIKDVPERDSIAVIMAQGIVFEKEGNNDKAIDKYNTVLEIANKKNFEDLELYGYRQLSNFYLRNGNKELANKYKLEYIDLKDSFINKSKLKEIKDRKFLEELNNKNEEMVKLSIKDKRNTTSLFISIIIIFIIVTTTFIIYYRNKNLKRKNIELYEKLQQSLLNPILKSEPSLIKIKMESSSDEEILKDENENNVETIFNQQEKKYKTSNLSHEDKKSILERINRYMESSDEIYNSNFTVEILAEEIGIHKRYVSQVINELGGSNFKTMLNNYRVREACRKLEDESQIKENTIEAIGQSVGFISRRNFGLAFKKATGLSPSSYVKIHLERMK